MLRTLAIASVAVLAALAPAAAHAENVATPRMAAVASWAAGKPISVWCESDPAAWERRLASIGADTKATGYAYAGSSEVFLGPTRCYGLLHPDEPREFGPGLNALLHESWHARGVADEAIAECAARVLIYSALHDFYRVPWFSSRMRTVVGWALETSYMKPNAYQDGCSRL
jgi:hypothetical protein